MDDTGDRVLTRRTFMAATGIAIAAPSLAVSQRTTPGIKAVVLVARKEGMTRDAFTRHWLDIHASMAAAVPGVQGFVGSEPIGEAVGQDQPFHETDGIASIWYPSREEIPAILGTPQGKAWLADGDIFISRPRSRSYAMREHVIVAGARVNGGHKRTLLLVRRQELGRERFREEWLGRNAELARKMPGIAGCVYSEVLNVAGPGPALDGMIETWWTGLGTADGGMVPSTEARAWVRDYRGLIDMARSRFITSREHIAIAPPVAS